MFWAFLLKLQIQIQIIWTSFQIDNEVIYNIYRDSHHFIKFLKWLSNGDRKHVTLLYIMVSAGQNKIDCSRWTYHIIIMIENWMALKTTLLKWNNRKSLSCQAKEQLPIKSRGPIITTLLKQNTFDFSFWNDLWTSTFILICIKKGACSLCKNGAILSSIGGLKVVHLRLNGLLLILI